jgi:hypothetical protein
VTFTIGNRPPSITSNAVDVESGCVESSSCCRVAEGYCDANSATVSGLRSLPSRWADADGDPISVAVAAVGPYTPAQPLVCTPDQCSLEISIAPTTVCVSTPVTYLPTTVTDGLASTTGSLPSRVDCI